MDIHSFTNLGFLAFLAPIVLFFQQSRNILLKILNVFWKHRKISYQFAYVFYSELCKKSKVIDFDDYELDISWLYINKHNRDYPILLKLSNFEILLYRYFIPIFVFGDENEGIKIQYLKFTFNFEKFLNQTITIRYKELENERMVKPDRFSIYEMKGKSLKMASIEKLSATNEQKSAFNTLSTAALSKKYYILSPRQIINNKLNKTFGISVNEISWNSKQIEKDKYIFTKQGKYILSQVDRWIKSEEWYKQRNIAYRRGILLYGKPGQGRSSLVLEIAKKLSVPIYIFDLSTYDNSEFSDALKNMSSESAIVVFEDLDCIYNGRELNNKDSQYERITFDCFINKLSGINSIKNKFIFITSNHIDKLDVALIRKGRIDEIIDLQPLDREEKFQVASKILDGQNKEFIDKIVKEGEEKEMSTAEFENLCVEKSLKEYWDKNE